MGRVKRALQGPPTGHGGTLDPFASGVLVLGVGTGCRALSAFLASPKEYRVTVRLGRATDTGDHTGSTTAEGPVPALDRERVEAAVRTLVGRQMQEPPMYSAKKQAGVPLYRLARQGVTVARPAVEIEVYAAALRTVAQATGDVEVDFTVSKGTYIRVLAERLGALLGAPAHALVLTRTRVGPFALEQCVPADQLDSGSALLAALARDTALARRSGIKV